MKRIRINNDIIIRWEIFTNGQAESLEGRNLRLELRSIYGKKAMEFEIEGNVIITSLAGASQRSVGVYSLVLQDTTDGVCRTIDECEAFELVPHSCMEYGADESNLHTEIVQLSSTMETGHGYVIGGATMEDIQQALDALQLALQGNDTDATLASIKVIVSAIPTATYTDALAAIQQVVDTLPKTTLTAADKADIIAAIQAATPTIDFTAVLNAISASESAIKEAMPTIPSDIARTGEYDAKLSALATQCAEIQSAIGYAENEINNL